MGRKGKAHKSRMANLAKAFKSRGVQSLPSVVSIPKRRNVTGIRKSESSCQPTCQPQSRRSTKTATERSRPDLRERNHFQDAMLLNPRISKVVHNRHKGIRGATLKSQRTRLIKIAKKYQRHRVIVTFGNNGNDELLERNDDDETEMEVPQDEFSNTNGSLILEADPLLLANDNISDVRNSDGNECLICFHTDPEPRPLKGILPKAKDSVRHPEQFEDDMRMIYLLKLMFEWTTSELNHLIKLSNGRSPREWFYLCQSCRLLVFEIQTLEDRMRECRKKIKYRMMKSLETSSMAPAKGGTMSRRIRIMVSEQVKSANANNGMFLDGDREAERLQNLKMQMSESESDPESSLESDVWSAGDEDSIFCEDAGMTETKAKKANKEDGSSKIERVKWSSSNEEVNEFFVCPYCHSDDTSSTTMDFVELYYHLIFHHDFPLKCSECKIFLPRDASILDNHWCQLHSIVTTPPDLRFIETRVVSDETKPDGEKPTAATLICPNCLKDDNMEMRFDSMKKFKIHQAVKHPSIARSSCPLCPFKFDDKNKASSILHLKNIHKVCPKDFWRSYLCRFCGKAMHDSHKAPLKFNNEPKRKLQHSAALHLISSHVDLINASFECKTCWKKFPSLKEFMEHADGIPNHSPVNWNADAEHLCRVNDKDDDNNLACGLCFEKDKEKSFKANNIHSFLLHLTQSHSLFLNWKSGPVNLMGSHAKFIWKESGEIEEMEEFCSVFRSDEDKDKLEEKALEAEAKYYTCPSCPELEEMNLDAFLVHLIFHWRRPNRCTSCKAYLPFASEAIEDHWKVHHPDLDSSTSVSTAVKYEPVQATSGDVFWCEKCPEKFANFLDRNKHEEIDGCRSAKTETCSACSEHFRTTEEVRIHKALDHPEIASVSCYYCQEQFPADLLEGGHYLDSEALHKHIQESKDQIHPKETSERKLLHLFACDYCGMVIEDNYMFTNRVRHHVLEKHGQVARQNKPISCYVCNCSLVCNGLWKHLSTKHAKNSICETCGEEMRPYALPHHNLAKHDVLMEGYQKLRCSDEGCDYITVYQYSLTRHVSVHHNKERPRRHKCSFCGKAFFTPRHLREHEERHQNKETRPYQCEICGGTYAIRNDLYIHKRLSHLNLKFPSTNRKRTRTTKTKRTRTPVASMSTAQVGTD